MHHRLKTFAYHTMFCSLKSLLGPFSEGLSPVFEVDDKIKRANKLKACGGLHIQFGDRSSLKTTSHVAGTFRGPALSTRDTVAERQITL